MRQPVNIKVNNKNYKLETDVNSTLLEVLRQQLGLMGTKEGCDGGECGACTVLLDGVPVLACLTLAVDVDGQSVTTVEGLAIDGNLDPLQEAFISEGAIQCGYCTPGMLLSARALINRSPNPSVQEIKEALSGNLCRCTGYAKIIKAVQKAAQVYFQRLINIE